MKYFSVWNDLKGSFGVPFCKEKKEIKDILARDRPY